MSSIFPITIHDIEQSCGKTSLNRGMEYYNSRKVSPITYSAEDKMFKAIVQGSKEYLVFVDLHSESYIYGTCSCSAYDPGQDYCKHIAAALFKLMNTNLSALTDEMTSGVSAKDKQFANSVLSLFGRTAAGPADSKFFGKPSAPSAEKQQLEVEFICKATTFSTQAGLMTMEMKLGPKRVYVVQKIKDFLDAYDKRKPFYFAKNFTYDPSQHTFKITDMAILDVLIETVRNEDAYRTAFGNQFGQSYSLRNDRLLYLPPHMWDKLVPLLTNDKVHVSFEHGLASSSKVEIVNNELPLRVELSKPASSYYQLDFDNLDRIEVMEKYGYVLAEGKLYPMKEDQLRRVSELKNSLHYAPSKQIRFESEQMETTMNTLIRGLRTVSSVNISKQIAERIVDVPLRGKLYLDREEDTLYAKLEYAYDEVTINPLEPEIDSTITTNRILMRDAVQEKQLLGYLEHAGFRKEGIRLWLEEEDAVYEFLYHTLPVLEKIMDVYATSTFRPIMPASTSVPKVSIDWDEKTRWLEVKFDLNGIDEKDIKQVLRSMVEKKKYVRLPDGSFLSLEHEGFQELAQVMQDMDIRKSDLKGDRMTLSVARGFQLLSSGIDVSRSLKLGRSFRRLLDNLNNPDSLDFPIPSELDGTLRDYQKYGFQWLKTLSHYRFGGILADDMGLGKTLQAIAFILSEKEQIRSGGSPVLIVCPASLTYNWRNEIAKFAPSLRAEVVAGARQERSELIQSLSEQDVIITSYPLLRRDMDLYEPILFHTLILDEAQAIKNHTTLTAQTVKEIRASQRFALTGTPVENSLEELWSIFDAIFPELFIGRRVFQDLTRETVARRVRPFILRRMKRDVLKELPDKIETLQTSELTAEQKKLYMAYLAKLREETVEHLNEAGFQKNRIKILAGLTRLRQLCCHPALFVDDYEGDSGKLEQLMEIVEEALSSGKRILLFSQFTGMLGIIRKELEQRGETCFYLDGQTPAAERVELCQRFNDGEQDLFLISLKAGGTGLNLTGADTVILYDLWWNPAVEQQATDRAHRIGQTNVVQVIRLLAQGTVEEKMYELQQKKKDLIDQVIQPGEEALSSMSEADLREILMI